MIIFYSLWYKDLQNSFFEHQSKKRLISKIKTKVVKRWDKAIFGAIKYPSRTNCESLKQHQNQIYFNFMSFIQENVKFVRSHLAAPAVVCPSFWTFTLASSGVKYQTRYEVFLVSKSIFSTHSSIHSYIHRLTT